MCTPAGYSQAQETMADVPRTPPLPPMIVSGIASISYTPLNANGSINKETERALESIIKEILDPVIAPRFQGCLPQGSTEMLNHSNESILFMDAMSSALQTR